MKERHSSGPKKQRRKNLLAGGGGLFLAIFLAGSAFADVPGGRVSLSGTSVPNPGTQQQELANITFPAPYNVFEFVVTCAACHGGSVDQQAAHFGNWAGTSMASAARDPVFRANEIIVNQSIKELSGDDGAGNLCFRCHSPNGWLSGRFDPRLAGAADGSQMLQSILLSTDGEGIMCETCHRVIGNVAMKRGDLDPLDKAWNMLAGLFDWPHQGNPYPAGPVMGNPYGDATLQFNDGMTYGGKYSGSVDLWFSDIPVAGTPYTGQTYGIYPPDFPNPGEPVVNPDGSVPIHYEQPIPPPTNPDGSVNYALQSISLEHPTFKGDFIRTSEFCGSCHDLTVPILNHGMPEQRTYTEWKYSDFGKEGTGTYKRCQDCHMPTLKHQYADNAPISLNSDPLLTGYFPYGKDRNPFGGTTFHKFSGSNLALPKMMTVLYPEVDLEVIGNPTGNDTRIFPGMLSDRRITWDRARRNTELMLKDAVTAQIVQGPSYDARASKWQVQVKVTNNSGHRIPSGYPDGRRFWVRLLVTNLQGGEVVYQSGYYDPATANLYNDATKAGFSRALTNTIDSANNAVMVYEKRTGTKNPDNTYTMSVSLLNDTILFDNRIPPAGFTYADYQNAGTRFWNYNTATFAPYEDVGRFPDGQNFDLVTYTFAAPAGLQLRARAEIYWDTHTRELMEYLKTMDTSTVRPEGPPNLFELNYPLVPNYLSDVIGLQNMVDLDGNPLRDNWGGIAYAAWLKADKGAPFLVSADDTGLRAKPRAPSIRAHASGPFTINVNWEPVPGAEGYIVWTRYGAADATASWDRLAVLTGYDNTFFVNDGLNVDKTYAYKVEAFNGKGSSISIPVVTNTPRDLPLAPEALKVVSTTSSSVLLAWYDAADNEIGFIIQRQDVPPTAPYYELTRIPSPNPGGFGGVNWTDTSVVAGKSYNYRVAAYNNSGPSTWTVPAVTATVPLPVAAVAPTSTNRLLRSVSSTPSLFTPSGMSNTGSGRTLLTASFYQSQKMTGDASSNGEVAEMQILDNSRSLPSSPKDLRLLGATEAAVTLTFKLPDKKAGFIVQRQDESTGGEYEEVARSSSPGKSHIIWKDEGVVAGLTYRYRVATLTGDNLSAWAQPSLWVAVPTDTPPEGNDETHQADTERGVLPTTKDSADK